MRFFSLKIEKKQLWVCVTREDYQFNLHVPFTTTPKALIRRPVYCDQSICLLLVNKLLACGWLVCLMVWQVAAQQRTPTQFAPVRSWSN